MAITWKKLAYEDDVILNTLMSGKGDIIIASGANTPARLAVGNDNEILRVATDLPNWEVMGAPAAHKDTHDPSGGDPLDTGAPNALLEVQAQAEGTAETFARSDHDHAIVHDITDNAIVTVDGSPADTEITIWNADGLDGATPAAVAASMALDDIGVPDAAVDFDLQEATDLVVMTVANEASLPGANVAVGQLCWATTELSLHAFTASA